MVRPGDRAIRGAARSALEIASTLTLPGLLEIEGEVVVVGRGDRLASAIVRDRVGRPPRRCRISCYGRYEEPTNKHASGMQGGSQVTVNLPESGGDANRV